MACVTLFDKRASGARVEVDKSIVLSFILADAGHREARVSGVSILVTTIDKADKAQALGRAALAGKLAACVQITPISSHYAWKGEYCEDEEFRLEMKHRTEDYAALAALVRRLHSYETPEILRIDVAEVDSGYAAWLMESTRRD